MVGETVQMGSSSATRSIGLVGATSIGVGAIVGGGILALAGVAFAAAGPAAMIAFAVNGGIAVLTALSFAEMSTAFPESGGTYTFAKKVLSVQSAFAVGWIVWFASIVAGVLYALGFASYGVVVVEVLWRRVGGSAPHWLGGRITMAVLAVGATLFYTAGLMSRRSAGGRWATIGKVVAFAVLIAGGLPVVARVPPARLLSALTPFFAHGALGVFQAMGYTFIALQGFDLIAAVAGQVRDPGRTIPRAMLLSLAIALLVYLPLLFLIATVGVPAGDSITALSARQPDTLVATAAQNYLGPTGFWLVIVAAVLSMLSALQANLLAASHLAFAMAQDRTLPRLLRRVRADGTPVGAIATTSAAVVVIVMVIPDVAAAGAAASLIFLMCFALTQWTAILARRRGDSSRAQFRVPWFPFVPVAGGLACAALALFQGVAVPSAGLVAGVWLCVGAALYLFLLARGARVADASAEALDPYLVQLRGRSPLVLVPIANPANAEAMVGVANALATPRVGRVVLLSVVAAPDSWLPDVPPPQLLNVQDVVRQALTASFAAGLPAEALTTVAARPWEEIGRVARTYRCESLLIGLSNLDAEPLRAPIEELMSSLDTDVAVLRAPAGWQLSQTRRVLIPVGGRGGHDVLRARLIGSLCRLGTRELTFLRVLDEGEAHGSIEWERRRLLQLAADEAPVLPQVEVVRARSVAEEVNRRAATADLVILGVQRLHRRRKMIGEVALQIARQTSCALLMISRRG